MPAIATNKKTQDGLTIYDLDPRASELCAVAGPAGIDPATIDSDNLPDGFRWIDDAEWEAIEDSTAFILVFRPHQRPAWADAFDCDQEFVDAWVNGEYDRSCSANNNLEDPEQEANYENAITDCGHDLHNVTRLDSELEVKDYLASRQHNMGISSVIKASKRLGWNVEDAE